MEGLKVEDSVFYRYYYSGSLLLLLLLEAVTDWYFSLSLVLFALTIFMILDRLGKGVVLRELIALYGIYTCLVMPVLGYTLYTQENPLARLWFKYMFVPKETYFSFNLPATTLFSLAICWPMATSQTGDTGQPLKKAMDRALTYLGGMHNTSLYIIIIGILANLAYPYLPGSLQFVSSLFFWSAFAGVLYLYYGPGFKHKKATLGIFAVFIFSSALRSGMFTLVAYMGITIFSFFFLGKKVAFWKKLSVFVIGCFCLLLLQSVKATYRDYVFRKHYQGSTAVLFTNLVADKITNFDLLSSNAFFPIYYRTNQGWNIALVMRRFPKIAPFDNGANLSINFLSALVPRLFWPDKPEAGGKFNMKYYTGIVITGWSTNIGPLGEAYGSFGTTGGILYMFILGLFIRWAYVRVFKLAWKTPLLIFWIPVLFYQVTYSAESDSLQIFNSLVKGAFFVWIVYRMLPGWFGIAKKNLRRVLPRKITPPYSQEAVNE